MSDFLLRNAAAWSSRTVIDPATARRLVSRTRHVPFFAHSYPFVLNMDHGGFGPHDLATFAHEHRLDGLCLHVNDGGPLSVARMDAPALARFGDRLGHLGLRLHLEISSTERAAVDDAVRLALALGVANIRLYARRSGPLSVVLEEVYADLAYVTEVANRHDLHVDYEQHEDLRAAEIAALLTRIGDPRLNVLFDYTNSWNAYEEPLDALAILRPFIRQVHIKGGRKTIEPTGWGQLGVAQGSAEDELPSPLLLSELLLLGEDAPQVIAFALENEAGYYAPAFRGPDDGADPLIAWRAPSQTPLPEGTPLAQRLADERRWAAEQVAFNRALVAELRSLAAAIVAETATA